MEFKKQSKDIPEALRLHPDKMSAYQLTDLHIKVKNIIKAQEHKIPFYVAAPLSTIDFNIKTGKEIPIEERAKEEVSHLGEKRVVPQGVSIWNPAFDVTPNRFIAAIITDQGLVKKPYQKNLKKLNPH